MPPSTLPLFPLAPVSGLQTPTPITPVMKTGDDGSLDPGTGSSTGRNTDLLTQLLNSRNQQPSTQANVTSLKQTCRERNICICLRV